MACLAARNNESLVGKAGSVGSGLDYTSWTVKIVTVVCFRSFGSIIDTMEENAL